MMTRKEIYDRAKAIETAIIVYRTAVIHGKKEAANRAELELGKLAVSFREHAFNDLMAESPLVKADENPGSPKSLPFAGPIGKHPLSKEFEICPHCKAENFTTDEFCLTCKTVLHT